MSFKKIDREFLLTDDSVNVYGFRLLTSGYLFDRYKNNPIGYRMHKREDGVVVKWEDFRTEGDRLYAKPNVNLANPLGVQTAREVQNGFLNAASMGGIVLVEWSDAPELMLEGQTGPTITKWYNKEISLVDVPGNPNAVVQLYDVNDREINLADFIQNTLKKQPIDLLAGFNMNLKIDDINMKKSLLSLLALASIQNLSDQTSDEAVLGHVRDLVDKANRVPGLEAQLQNLTADKNKAVQDLADFKKAENTAKVKVITDAAIVAGKLTVPLANDLAGKYADDPQGLQKLVERLPTYKTVTSQIGTGKPMVNDLADKSWSELDKSGKLPDLKAADPELFKQKFRERFGTEYTGQL